MEIGRRMKIKAVSGIMLTLLLIGMLTLAFNIQPVKAEPTTWTVDDDGPADFHTIQEAINAANPGDTIYVHNGTYYENVVVNKSISLIGENRNTTIIDGNKTGNVVRVVTADVYLRNFTIRNSRPPPPSPWWARGDSGIYLGGYSNNIIIRDNVITDCYGGIEIVVSCNNTIEKNNLFNNSNFGIRLHDSSGNTINGNAISGIGVGIYLDFEANGNLIINNTISNTGSGIDINFDCTSNLLNGNKISSCTFGVSSYPCYNNTATGNVILNCNSGIFLEGSKNIITGNNVSYCEYGGVHIALSNFTVVSGNLLTHNGMGIWINKGDHNTIFGNTLISNDHGFDVRYCNNNTFYQNNVINNTIQAYLVDTINEWDNGYPSGGNYWSDYTGVDFFSGSYQNETGSDGIGDTPYVIDENNQDNYPLVNPWTPAPPTVVATADVVPNTLNLKSKGKWITCYIELPKGYDVSDIDRTTILLNDTIPVDPFWIDKPLESVVGDYDDDGIPDLMFKFSRTEVSEYIHYVKGITYGDVTLTITGELYDRTLFEGSDVIRIKMPSEVNSDDDEYVDIYDIAIPEFPSFLVLPVFMTATLLAVIVYRRMKYQAR